jgi:5-methylcytosine-specific restriction endonuclease McrA
MRFEFNRSQRREIRNRAGGHCEACTAKLKLGEGEYDHSIAQGYGGENTVENGQLLCKVCHGKKTGVDKGITEKVKRIRDKHLGVWPKTKAPLRGRGFPSTRSAVWQFPQTKEAYEDDH